MINVEVWISLQEYSKVNREIFFKKILSLQAVPRIGETICINDERDISDKIICVNHYISKPIYIECETSVYDKTHIDEIIEAIVNDGWERIRM